MTTQEHIIKSLPVLAALVKPSTVEQPKTIKKNDPYQKAMLTMIAALLAAEAKLMQAGVKNQEFQSQIHMTSSQLTTALCKKQRHEIQRAQEAKKNESGWDKVMHKLAPVLEVASIVITCAICPAMAPVAIGLGVASKFGAIDKLCDAIGIPPGFGRAAFKMALIAGISYGSGAWVASRTAEEAGAEAAEESSTKAAAKSSGRWLAGSMAVPTVNPTQDLVYGSLRAAGMSKAEANEIAKIVAGIVNMIASIVLAYKAKGPLPGTSSPKLLNAVVTAGQAMQIGGSIGMAYASIKKGQAEMEQADITDELAKVKNGLAVLKEVNSASKSGIQQATNQITNLAKAFEQENKGFYKLTQAEQAEAELSGSQAV